MSAGGTEQTVSSLWDSARRREHTQHSRAGLSCSVRFADSRMLKTALLVFALGSVLAHAQWSPQTSNTTAALRGLSVVNENVVWASGTKGTFLRTTDGGATWQAGTVPGVEALDFRDV